VHVSIIAAVAHNGLIGRDNRLPWHLPRDLKRFRKLTLGNSIVMGRRTFESLGRPLDGRHNIVLTRNTEYRLEGCHVVRSLDEAIALARSLIDGDGAPEVFVIGGAEVFRDALPLARKVYLTTVSGEFEGNVYFPLDVPNSPEWRVVREEDWATDEKNPHPHRFQVFERRAQTP
jgi:dihydrofolate reductase